MKTAYIYPGLNGLLRAKDRARFLPLPEVQSRFQQAEKALAEQVGVKVDLNELLSRTTEEIYSIDNISLAAVAICSIQCGVGDRLKATQATPDWVMGCSLGDLARAVFSEAYSFEDAVVNHVKFTRDIGGINKIGKNIGVSTAAGTSFTAEDFAWFDQIQVDVSHFSPRFLNIGGRFEELRQIEERAIAMGWKTQTILEYPAHSRYILPYVEKVKSEVLDVNTTYPKVPIFSSFSARQLTDPQDIKREFVLSITQTIHWDLAVTKLVKEQGVTRFVNIGPCTSLTALMKDIPVQVETMESFELLGLS